MAGEEIRIANAIESIALSLAKIASSQGAFGGAGGVNQAAVVAQAMSKKTSAAKEESGKTEKKKASTDTLYSTTKTWLGQKALQTSQQLIDKSQAGSPGYTDILMSEWSGERTRKGMQGVIDIYAEQGKAVPKDVWERAKEIHEAKNKLLNDQHWQLQNETNPYVRDGSKLVKGWGDDPTGQLISLATTFVESITKFFSSQEKQNIANGYK